MTPAEVDAYAEAVAASWPEPSPAQAARLRALLNPIDLPERLDRLRHNAVGHHAEPADPPTRNRGRHRDP